MDIDQGSVDYYRSCIKEIKTKPTTQQYRSYITLFRSLFLRICLFLVLLIVVTCRFLILLVFGDLLLAMDKRSGIQDHSCYSQLR